MHKDAFAQRVEERQSERPGHRLFQGPQRIEAPFLFRRRPFFDAFGLALTDGQSGEREILACPVRFQIEPERHVRRCTGVDPGRYGSAGAFHSHPALQ